MKVVRLWGHFHAYIICSRYFYVILRIFNVLPIPIIWVIWVAIATDFLKLSFT